MNVYRHRRALAVALALVLAGCAPALLSPTEADVPRAQRDWPGSTLEDLGRGRAVYVAKCSGCHTLFIPESRAAKHWPNAVNKMAERSRLTAAEKRDITRFLVTMSGR